MKRRMNRYLDNTEKPKSNVKSRRDRNRHLYGPSSSIEVSSFDGGIDIFKSTDEDDAKYISLDDLKKIASSKKPVFDINKYLEEAKEARKKDDEEMLQDKKNEEYYNVLSNLNKKYVSSKTEDLENLVKEVKESVKEETTIEETMLKALMETKDFTKFDTKTLEKVLDGTSEVTIEKDSSTKENTVTEKTIEKKEPETAEQAKVYVEGGKFVNSFYTRSMDLSDKDFATYEEEKTSGKKLVIFLVICIIIIIIAIGALLYFYKI